VRPDELERRLHERLDALGPARRAELLHVLTLPDLDRVGAIQSYWANSETRTFGELLIDCEEDRLPPSGARRHAAGGRSTATGRIGRTSTTTTGLTGVSGAKPPMRG
jgi:hypothetical protein